MISRTDREPNTMSALIDRLAAQHDLRGFARDLNAAVHPDDRGSHPSLGNPARSARSVALDNIAPSTAIEPPTKPPQARKLTHQRDPSTEREI